MSDRTRSAAAHGASRPGRTAAPAGPDSRSKSIFRSQLIRRPTASSTNSAETLRLDGDAGSPASDSSEIVVRDQHGEVEVENPPTPVVDDEDELADMEYRQELDRQKQRLTEAVKHHQTTCRSSDEPEELLEAVRASLRARVAALAEDNWMFEPEEQTRG